MKSQKNKLLNAILSFEIAFNDAQSNIDSETNLIAHDGRFSDACARSCTVDIIKRNIQSIKKQLDNL